MSIDLNEKPSSTTIPRVAVRLLRIAVIAGVVSACSTMGGPLESDADDAASASAGSEASPPAPPVEQVTEEKRASFDDFLSSQGYQDVQFVALAYSEGGQERLIVLQFYGSEEIDPREPEDRFLIPPVGVRFGEAVVIYSGSPASTTTCGRPFVSGGTRYRNCNY